MARKTRSPILVVYATAQSAPTSCSPGATISESLPGIEALATNVAPSSTPGPVAEQREPPTRAPTLATNEAFGYPRHELVAQRGRSTLERRAHILVVDHDPRTVELLSRYLKLREFEVSTAADGRAALDQVLTARPDAVILDVALPGMSAFEVLRQLRSRRIATPVLFLSARDTLEDKIIGLRLGADDYITAPFSMEELVARLHVILRRTGIRAPESRSRWLTFADIQLNEEFREVSKAGAPVSLTPKGFTLLHYFMTNAGIVLSKERIFAHVWRETVRRDPRIVESLVSLLRRKIESDVDRRLIHTQRGFGYVLRDASNTAVQSPP